MTCENTNALTAEGVPDVASPVVVTTEEDAARDGECDGGDTAKDIVVSEDVELTVSTDIEQTA